MIISPDPPLLQAVISNDEERLKQLLKTGTDANQKSEDDITPLLIAAGLGRINMMTLLIEHGAKVDLGTEQGDTPLMVAAQLGQIEAVDKLLTAGAKVDATKKNNINALYLAVQEGHSEVVARLLKAGADVNQPNENSFTPLLLAAQYGHGNILNLLLQAGANVNQANNDGATPLHIAASKGNSIIVQQLLDSNATVDQEDKNGYTPLFCAAVMGHFDISVRLRLAGADPDKIVKKDEKEITPFSIVTKQNYVDLEQILDNKVKALHGYQFYLLEKMREFGYYINTEGLCFGIAMMGIQAFLTGDNMMSFNDRLHFISKLSKDKFYKLAHSTTINEIITLDGISMSLADIRAFFDGIVLYQDPDSYKTIFPTAKIQEDKAAASLITPVELDSETNQPLCLKGFCGIYSQDDLVVYLEELSQTLQAPTALHLQSSNHSINLNFDPKIKKWFFIDANSLPAQVIDDSKMLAKAILEAFETGADKSSWTAFHTSLYIRTSERNVLEKNLKSLATSKSWQAIHNISAEKAAAIDNKDANWLYMAARHGHPELILPLIKEGANVNHKTGDLKLSPLHIAVEKNQDEVITELLSIKDVDINITNHDGQTPLFRAAYDGNEKAVLQLIEKGADVNLADIHGNTPLHVASEKGYVTVVQALIKANANLHQLSENGFSALYAAVQYNHHSDVVSLLLKSGADVNQPNGSHTVLLRSVIDGNIEMTRLLLNEKAEVNKVTEDVHGVTPLMLAAQEGHTEIVSLLLNAGADVDKKSKDGRTAAIFAKKNGHTDIIKLLQAPKTGSKASQLGIFNPIDSAKTQVLSKQLKRSFSHTVESTDDADISSKKPRI